MEPERHDEEPELPQPTLWPVGFAVGVTVLLIGIVVSTVVAAVGGALTALFGVPLDPRPQPAAPRASRARGRAGRPARRSATHVPAPAEAEALPAQQVPRGRDARPRRGHRRRRLGARARLHGRARLHQPGPPGHRPRPDLELPRGQVRDRDVHARTRSRARSAATPRTSATTGCSGKRAELHDHLQPLRAPRLPGAAERAALREPEEDRARRRPTSVTLIPTLPAGLRLPVPRRPVRHRGQPHRRPARPRARPLRVPDQRTATSSSATPTASRKVDGAGRQREDLRYGLTGPGAARRRARGLALSRSSRPD